MNTPQKAPLSEDAILQVTRQVLERHEGRLGTLLPILHDVQHAVGYIPAVSVPVIAQALQRSRAEVQGVISFYPHFRETPAGRHVLEICRAEACQSMGAEELAEQASRKLGCDFHSTRSDGAISLEPVYCLGLCAQSPAIMLDGKPHARMTPERLDALLAEQGVQA